MKSFKSTAWLLPQPVLIIGTYDKEGKPNAMNAAWGGQWDMWYRFSRREDDYCIECSSDGQAFSQMRVCHIPVAADEISFGIYACSPEESSFTAIFSDMKITECAWKAHDGQQPDENM